MDSLEKSSAFKSVIRHLENEHQLIHDILSKINYAENAGLNNKIKEMLLREFYKCIDFHFTSEENTMLIFNLEGYKEHKEEHDKLRYKLAELIGSFDIDETDLSELDTYTTTWLNDHNKYSDSKLAADLNKKLID